MSNDIQIKKGLNIKLIGEAEQSTTKAVPSNGYAIELSDFHGIIPKMLVKEGNAIKAGEPVFFNKANEDMKFVSPVSGEIISIERGERRRILTVKIQADKEQKFQENKIINPDSMKPEEIKAYLLASGVWPFVKQRPYDVIADSEKTPKAIFISGYASAPLAADYDYILNGKGDELQAAISALVKLTDGKIHVSVGKGSNSPLAGLNGVETHTVSGPHPSGNVGTLIAKVNPINKGEIVWTINPHDLVIIGELILTGKYNAERTIALTGSCVKSPRYYTTKIGAEVSTIVYDGGLNNDNIRIINGNVLTGTKVNPDGYLGFYNSSITVIPEGNDYELFGWNKPIFNKISVSRALTFSWMLP